MKKPQTKIGESFEFVAGERYAEKGVFVTRRPDEATVIDLGGAFVVPPFGEAHNHSVDGPGTEETAEKYLAEGVYYYKNPNSIYSFTEPMLDYWARPETLDVSFSYGGLSTDEGHPEKLYRMLLGFGMYSATDAEDLDGNAFYDVNTIEQLDEKLRRRTCVVFDATDPPRDRPHRFDIDHMSVRFAVDYAEADDLLEEIIAQHSAPKQLAVVSSDRRIQVAASRRGASRRVLSPDRSMSDEAERQLR